MGTDLKWSRAYVVLNNIKQCIHCYEGKGSASLCNSIALSDDLVVEESVLLGPLVFTISLGKDVLMTIKTENRTVKLEWMAALENTITKWD